MTQVRIDLSDPTPPYEQLRRGILQEIHAGRLQEGDRLPPIRVLARDLGLAIGTVGRAYKELEAAGAILTRRGGGSRIARSPLMPPDRSASAGELIDQDLQDLMCDAVAAARELGYDDRSILEATRRELVDNPARTPNIPGGGVGTSTPPATPSASRQE